MLTKEVSTLLLFIDEYMNVVNPLYDRLRVLPITDLAPVFTNGVRGRTMSASSCSWLISKVRELGVKTIIDLRTADHTDKYQQKVTSIGLAYRHIAIDSKNIDTQFFEIKKTKNS